MLGVATFVLVGPVEGAGAAGLYPGLEAACAAQPGETGYHEQPIGLNGAPVQIFQCDGYSADNSGGDGEAAGEALDSAYTAEFGVQDCGNSGGAYAFNQPGSWYEAVGACGVGVEVSGSETVGLSPSFTYTSDAPPAYTLSGQATCSTVDGGTPITSTLAPGQYTIDASSCSGVTGTLGRQPVYVGVPNGFVVTGPCAAGFYSASGNTPCTAASAGYYVGGSSATSQTPCATGYYQPAAGQSSCTPASTGYYVGATGSSSQTPCSAGYYQPATGQSSCTPASTGYWSAPGSGVDSLLVRCCPVAIGAEGA